jgi:hypothetical protein
LPAGGGAHNVTLEAGEFTARSLGNFNPAQSPAGWERTPSGCKDLRTGLIWASWQSGGGSGGDFWFAQDDALSSVQDGYNDYGLPTIQQMQTAAGNGITSQASLSSYWSTSMVDNSYGWEFDFRTETAIQTPIGPYYRWLIFVRGPGVVHADDGDPAFTDTVAGWNTVTGSGQDGDYRWHAKGTGSAKATWTFTGLSTGQYKVLAKWVAVSGNAIDAPYKIFDGSTLLKTTKVNQKNAPSSNQPGGFTIPWGNLGTVAISSGTLKVELTDKAKGNVVADMVRLVPISPTGVAATVATRDTNAASVNAAIASHYNDDSVGTRYADPAIFLDLVVRPREFAAVADAVSVDQAIANPLYRRRPPRYGSPLEPNLAALAASGQGEDASSLDDATTGN